jgi:hypothetical protein
MPTRRASGDWVAGWYAEPFIVRGSGEKPNETSRSAESRKMCLGRNGRSKWRRRPNQLKVRSPALLWSALKLTLVFPGRSKTRGSAAVEEVILARKRVNALFQSMTVLRDALGDPDSTAHVLLYAESRVENAEAAWRREQQKLKRLEQQLGVTDATLIEKLRHSDYYAARMNAKVMKDRLRQRLREHKFELDLIERSFRRSRSGVWFSLAAV